METVEREPIPLSSLPFEVLVHIFSYLSLSDRQSVRLTCRQYYDLCTVFSIRRNEKFVLKADANVTEFVNFLQKTQQRYVSLEFQKMKDFSRVPDLLQLSGEKLYSLDFHNSPISDSMMESIITNCINLVEFQIILSPGDFTEFDFHKVLFSPKAFDDPIQKKVKRTKLRVFSIVVDYVHIPSWLLRKVFLVYPCIEKFHIGSFTYSSCMRTSSFPRPRKYLKHFDELESLVFNVMSTGGWIKSWINQPKMHPKLKRFEVILWFTEPSIEMMHQFFSIQTNLRVVILTFINYPLNDGSTKNLFKLINHVYVNCTALREFSLLARP